MKTFELIDIGKSIRVQCISLIIIYSLIPQDLQAQQFSLKISTTLFSIESTSYAGYSGKIAQPYSLVKKEWWRYIRKIAALENHKTHYVITFPSDENTSGSGLSFVSVLQDDSSFVTIKTALKNQQNNEQYKKYARNLLLAFKVRFYTEIMQEQINSSEKESAKISHEIDRYRKKITAVEHKKTKGKGNRIALTKNIYSYQHIQDSLSIELQKTQFKIENNKLKLNKIK